MITIDPPSSPRIDSHTDLFGLSKSSLARFLVRARVAIGLPGSVSVLLSTDAELKRLNLQFRGKNKPTDVLSFPADSIPGLPSAHQHAGDLAVSLETASRQAAEHGHTLAAELRILLLHGLLHLAGLDHETDRGEMAARETELRSRFRLPSGLIARTLTPKNPSTVPKRQLTTDNRERATQRGRP